MVSWAMETFPKKKSYLGDEKRYGHTDNPISDCSY
jgi:hypothetical protein